MSIPVDVDGRWPPRGWLFLPPSPPNPQTSMLTRKRPPFAGIENQPLLFFLLLSFPSRRSVGYVDFPDEASAMTARNFYGGWKIDGHNGPGLSLEVRNHPAEASMHHLLISFISLYANTLVFVPRSEQKVSKGFTTRRTNTTGRHGIKKTNKNKRGKKKKP